MNEHYRKTSRTFSHYTVEANGHGARNADDTLHYVRNNPPEKLTLAEAKRRALHWCSYADTIGGIARVVDLRTNQIVWQP